ncbi:MULTISPECIES: hypothetical protein [Aphanothece]|uniref:hypothetical protein n=1 Tax=Aphanothece TaxID=1121 RepID=UPI00398F85D4
MVIPVAMRQDWPCPFPFPSAMQRSVPWLPILLIGALLLAPLPFGRFLLDLLGGITLTLLLLPVLLGAVGFIAWQVLRRRLQVCPACGFTSLGLEVCPACGTSLGASASAERPSPRPDSQVFGSDREASTATIDVEVVSSQSMDSDSRSEAP